MVNKTKCRAVPVTFESIFLKHKNSFMRLEICSHNKRAQAFTITP